MISLQCPSCGKRRQIIESLAKFAVICGCGTRFQPEVIPLVNPLIETPIPEAPRVAIHVPPAVIEPEMPIVEREAGIPVTPESTPVAQNITVIDSTQVIAPVQHEESVEEILATDTCPIVNSPQVQDAVLRDIRPPSLSSLRDETDMTLTISNGLWEWKRIRHLLWSLPVCLLLGVFVFSFAKYVNSIFSGNTWRISSGIFWTILAAELFVVLGLLSKLMRWAQIAASGMLLGLILLLAIMPGTRGFAMGYITNDLFHRGAPERVWMQRLKSDDRIQAIDSLVRIGDHGATSVEYVSEWEGGKRYDDYRNVELENYYRKSSLSSKLAGRLTDADPEIRSGCIRVLAKLSCRRWDALNELDKATQHADADVRKLAVHEMIHMHVTLNMNYNRDRELNDQTARQSIERSLGDSDPAIFQKAMKALEKIDPYGIVRLQRVNWDNGVSLANRVDRGLKMDDVLAVLGDPNAGIGGQPEPGSYALNTQFPSPNDSWHTWWGKDIKIDVYYQRGRVVLVETKQTNTELNIATIHKSTDLR